MAHDRLTLFGLAVALLGWVVLCADVALGPFVMAPGSMAQAAALRADVGGLAQATVGSGFALALLGTLRAGFGGLNRFFGAVLDRAGSAGAPSPEPVVAMPGAFDATMLHPVEAPGFRPGEAGFRPAEAGFRASGPDFRAVDAGFRPADAGFRPTEASAPRGPAPRGRNYVILANGAVEVDTLLGTRVFASLEEARGYIR